MSTVNPIDPFVSVPADASAGTSTTANATVLVKKWHKPFSCRFDETLGRFSANFNQ